MVTLDEKTVQYHMELLCNLVIQKTENYCDDAMAASVCKYFAQPHPTTPPLTSKTRRRCGCWGCPSV